MSGNGKLILYLINRDLILSRDSISTLHAVVNVDPEEIVAKKVLARQGCFAQYQCKQRFLHSAVASLNV